MGVDSLNGKQDAPPQRPPALLQSTGINWSWGVWVVVTWVFAFPSFFLFYWRASDGQTWKQLLICIERGRQGWAEDTLNCLLGKSRKSTVRSYHFSTLGGFSFFFLLSVIHFGRKPKFNFKQSTKTWKWGTKIRQPNAPGWPHNSCPSFFLIKDVTLTGWLSWLVNCPLHQKLRVRFRVKVHT